MKPPSTLRVASPVLSGKRPGAPLWRQAGAFTVELALVLFLFLAMVFTIIEVSRALYMWNTLQEVTRRAARSAATTNFKDGAAMTQLRREAIFRSTSGELAFGAPITDQHIVIDYMALTNQNGGGTTQMPIPHSDMPGCPVRNRIICSADSGDTSCVRFVRVRICQPGSNCTPVPYKTMLPLVDLPLNLPMATTIVRAQSLGYAPGMAICP